MSEPRQSKAETRIPRLLFDRRDHELLRMVNEVLDRQAERDYSQRKFYPYLHPRGIKELAESRGLRIGYAIIHLLESLEAGKRTERVTALRSLREEVLNASAGSMPRNTARVLLQIMKDLVRSRGDTVTQLKLAHEFRRVATGKPRIVRKQLRRYHLLELPEEWNHLAFDDHVHDANTKGRKSPTHLIMDAWIKGIRRLRVIYYNYIQPESAAELMEAAEIMGLTIRIGIEFSAPFRNRYVQLIWVPRGFQDAQAFLSFLREEPVRRLMEEGKDVSRHQQKYIMQVLDEFNRTHREAIKRDYGLDIPPLSPEEFLSFVKPGQPSLLHLAKFIHTKLLPLMKEEVFRIQAEWDGASPEERAGMEDRVARLNLLDDEEIYRRYLNPSRNPNLPNPHTVHEEPGLPVLRQLTPCELLHRLAGLRAGYRITLNLSNLWAEDVLELLFDCEGMITRLEIFNLKDHAENKTEQIPEINELQTAINEGNLIKIKRVIRQIIERVSRSDASDRLERVEKLTAILHDILSLKSLYQATRLKSRIGSDSTGQTGRIHGMGLAIIDSLPTRARKEIVKTLINYLLIPMKVKAYRRTIHIPVETNSAWLNRFIGAVGGLPLFRSICFNRRDDWIALDHTTQMTPGGNIITLGGIQEETGNGFSITPKKKDRKLRSFSWSYLDNRLKLFIKIVAGFLPAFATFALSYDWWLLKYGGAPIWFGITGLRNILQSVLGGGGFRRSPLLRWNDYISWDRITDSLLFTGFSVPLLDFLVKNLILDKALGITTSTNPVVLYTLMALANGLYLSSHNAFRGLPRGAIIGNFFRSVISIPIAIGFNMALGGILGMAGVVGVEAILQKWAAVISKAASDVAAGVIEGTADRHQNIGLRLREYKEKLAWLIEVYSNLELCFPETRVMEKLESLDESEDAGCSESNDLENAITVHALDMLYFWMYQPRARTALKRFAGTLTDEELRILTGCQQILKRQREISLLFIDGIIGKNFSRGLSFYLNHGEDYLANLQKLIGDREFKDDLVPEIALLQSLPKPAADSPDRVQSIGPVD